MELVLSTQNFLISSLSISLLVTVLLPLKRSFWIFLAFSTRSLIAFESSDGESAASFSNLIRGTSTWRSIRSRMGPEILRWYFMIADGLQEQIFCGSVALPQGQGFIAAMSVKRAGNSRVPWARETEMRPSSSGCLKFSKTPRANSGNSSKNKIPR